MALRILVTHPSAHAAFPARAREDIGVDAVLIAATSEELLARTLAEPHGYDLVQPEYWMLPLVWPRGVLQPIRSDELADHDAIRPLYIDGTVDGAPTTAAGQAPHTVQFVDPATGGLARAPTAWLALAPTICNSDTLGWRPDLSPFPSKAGPPCSTRACAVASPCRRSPRSASSRPPLPARRLAACATEISATWIGPRSTAPSRS